jgi:pyruvate kinase
MFDYALQGGVKSGLVKEGDLVVITAGVPLGRSGSTNLLKVDQIPQEK